MKNSEAVCFGVFASMILKILKITKNVCGSISNNPHAPELPRSYRLKFPPLHRSENEQSDTVWKTQSGMLKSLPEFQAFYHYIKVRWMQQIRSWNARTEKNNPLGFLWAGQSVYPASRVFLLRSDFQDQISNDKRNCHGYHHLDSNFAVFLWNTKHHAEYNPENTGISYRGESRHNMVKNWLMNLLQCI